MADFSHSHYRYFWGKWYGNPVARDNDFDVTPYPLLCGLAERLSVRPGFARMQAIDPKAEPSSAYEARPGSAVL